MKLRVPTRAAGLSVVCHALLVAAEPQVVHRLTLAEYEGTLRHWRQQHPQTFSFERRAETTDSLPIYALRITDQSVPDVDKQVCLVTALHSGPERTGTTGCLALAEWLLGDDPEARETRRRQVVIIMPVMNPTALFHTDRFRNSQGIDPYNPVGRAGKVFDLKTLTLKSPQDAPEIAAYMSVVDQYRPEVHADLHGIGLQEFSAEQLGSRRMFAGQTMSEITGSAYSNFILRPWDWRITEAMIAAGRDAGFGSDRFEADAQRALWGPEVAPLANRLWTGQPLFYTAHYGYFRHHTMILAMEVGWEESAVARMRGLLRIGNQPWLDERAAGYPVNRVKSFIGSFITAHGTTAAERCASRVELWSKQAQMSLGILYPQMDGRASLVCAFSEEAKKAARSSDLASFIDGAAALVGKERAESVRAFITAGPEIKLAMDAGITIQTDPNAGAIEHGIGFRLRLPHQKPGKLDVRLNGEPLGVSDRDGYEAWFADGFTQVQVHVPPAKAKTPGLFIITCGYQPEVVRRTGWLPPQAVREQFASDRADALPPSFAEVPYGEHFRQTIDVWQAKTTPPTPLVVFIHGGGWAADDKSEIHSRLDVRRLLDAGISVAAVNYRFIQDAAKAGVAPPLQWPLDDSARALQFIRSKAAGWRIDSSRVAVCGVSAGGCAALWLALHDDMADAASADPISRESTRVVCAAAIAPQTQLDPHVLREWMPNFMRLGDAFGFRTDGKDRNAEFQRFHDARGSVLKWIDRYSPIHHASAGDPPLFLTFPRQTAIPLKGQPQDDAVHSALMGIMLRERLAPLGVDVQLHYPAAPPPKHDSIEAFLIERLKTVPR